MRYLVFVFLAVTSLNAYATWDGDYPDRVQTPPPPHLAVDLPNLFERYLPGYDMRVHDIPSQSMQALLHAFEILEPLRAPQAGGAQATYIHHLKIHPGSALSFFVENETHIPNPAMDAGSGISGDIYFVLEIPPKFETMPIEQAQSELVRFLGKKIPTKIVRDVAYETAIKEWESRVNPKTNPSLLEKCKKLVGL